MLGNGTSTARMEAGSMPFFFKPWSTETWMMAPSAGVAITLPLRSCMLVIAESFRTIKCVLGLSLVSIPCPATATTSIPASTALIRSGDVEAVLLKEALLLGDPCREPRDDRNIRGPHRRQLRGGGGCVAPRTDT